MNKTGLKRALDYRPRRCTRDVNIWLRGRLARPIGLSDTRMGVRGNAIVILVRLTSHTKTDLPPGKDNFVVEWELGR